MIAFKSVSGSTCSVYEKFMKSRASIVAISCGWEGVLSCGKRASVEVVEMRLMGSTPDDSFAGIREHDGEG